jgi:hypothetical protein
MATGTATSQVMTAMVAELVIRRLKRPTGGVNAENRSVGGSSNLPTSCSIDFSVIC